MRSPFSINLPLLLGAVALSSVAPACLRAQLTRESGPPAPAIAPSQKETSAPAGKRRVSQDISIDGASHWTDTKIEVQPVERVSIRASGKMRYADAGNDNGPEGLSRGWKDLLRILPVKDAGRGAMIARIGDADIGEPFLVGAKRDIAAPTAGHLYLGINQANNESAGGSFRVHVEVYEPDAAVPVASVARDVAQISGVDASFFKKIPRRIADKDGNPGDMVNFLILGSEIGVQQAFGRAGWVRVDSTPKDAILNGILESLSKESYVQMPMSQLYLFERFQDYGFAHAEPLAVVAQRHHLRLWKAPFTVNGETLWVGAATHDIGFERDKRNNGITHKIDPDIDLERAYVEKTLSSTGMVFEKMHFLPDNPMKEAKTATGGSFHSNGQVLILKLGGAGRDVAANFAEVFCSVLAKEKPDGGEWGACGEYLHGAAPSAARDLDNIPVTTYRILVLPGVLSSCQAGTQAFQEGQQHLREKHGMSVDFSQLANDASEANGKKIAAYLREQMQKDARKYIVVAYSKGAPDMMEALAADPETRSAVAAFVTIAGAVGGSPIADTMPAIAERYAGDAQAREL